MAFGSDVDVDSAASRVVALGSGSSQASHQLLQGLDVVVVKDRGDHLAFLAVRSGDGNVPLELIRVLR